MSVVPAISNMSPGNKPVLRAYLFANINVVQRLTPLIVILGCVFIAGSILGHTISGSNATYVKGIEGPAIAPFMYLGAKHMVTGLDHLLFLAGVVFFLFKARDIILYVSLFTLGHSITLLSGVLFDLQVNANLIDAIIAFSIVYKAFENMGGFAHLPFQPDTRIAVLVFGLFHGLGLATKLQEFSITENGLLTNIVSFNLGVEIGQVIALLFILAALKLWRKREKFVDRAYASNSVLMCAGFILAGYQITAYMVFSQ